MRTSKSQELPPRLEALRGRFKQWRRTRKIGSRIPDPLWAAAVKLAESFGIHPTAKALCLDYYTLKRRLEKNSGSRWSKTAPANDATFVELAASPRVGVQECILELEDVEGARMRIHLKGIEAPDLAALSRSFWGSE